MTWSNYSSSRMSLKSRLSFNTISCTSRLHDWITRQLADFFCSYMAIFHCMLLRARRALRGTKNTVVSFLGRSAGKFFKIHFRYFFFLILPSLRHFEKSFETGLRMKESTVPRFRESSTQKICELCKKTSLSYKLSLKKRPVPQFVRNRSWKHH